jgi:hypothetical protein
MFRPTRPLEPISSHQGTGAALVVDANGTVVGRFMNRNGDVLMQADGESFIVNATRSGITYMGALIHQDANCSDAPNGSNVNVQILAQLVPVSAGTAWVPDRTAAA